MISKRQKYYGLNNMEVLTRYIIAGIMIFHCDAVTFEEQLDHIAKRRQESRGIPHPMPSRRLDDMQSSVILGAPSMPSHLPEAEPILPGHTLLRPVRNMLKSALKFPHKDLDNGAGVYGNVNNLGIRYDGRNERVRYSGFRRMPNDLLVAFPKYQTDKRISLSSFLELSDKSEEYKVQPLRAVKLPRPKRFKGLVIKIKSAKHVKKNKKKKKVRTDVKKKNKHSLKILPASYHKKMFKKIVTDKPNKKRFGPPGQKSRNKYYLKALLDSMRRDHNGEEINIDNGIILPDGESSSDDYNETEAEEKKKKVSKEVKGKLEWFWNSKDAYNNIKINQDAPELSELIPDVAKEKLREWWFYHQDDFRTFKD